MCSVPGYFSDILVGAICSRYEPLDGPRFKVYIMTIGVLAPYRRLGIGALPRAQTHGGPHLWHVSECPAPAMKSNSQD